jgi:hypothetical protein
VSGQQAFLAQQRTSFSLLTLVCFLPFSPQSTKTFSFSPSFPPDLGLWPERALLWKVCPKGCAHTGRRVCGNGQGQGGLQNDARGVYSVSVKHDFLQRLSDPLDLTWLPRLTGLQVRLVNEQLRLERDRSDGASVRSTGSAGSGNGGHLEKPAVSLERASPRLTRLAMGESSTSKTPKCNSCGKSAYAAESVNVQDVAYHKACFKCFECKARLTLTTYKVRQAHSLLRAWIVVTVHGSR